jgi:hypothetical protein
MGRVLFEVGRLEAALPELTAYTQEMERCMPEDKMVAVMREQLAAGHHHRGKALLALARAEDAPGEQAKQRRAEGCSAQRRAMQLYESLGDNGGRVPPELRSELENCLAVDVSE